MTPARIRGIKRKRDFRRAQTVIEYAALIVLLVFAFVAMQVYFKRGAQGRLKGLGDTISGGILYHPTKTVSDYTTTTYTNTTSSYGGGTFKRNITDPALIHRSGYDATAP